MPSSLKSKIQHAIIFLLWPFLSLIISLRNGNNKWAKNIFWLFCVYYGFTFVVASPELDAFRYIESFKTLSRNAYTFKEFLTFLYSGETQYVDILNPFVSFILSRFTNDGRILLAAYGMIFGFFYSRNIWYLFERVNLKNSSLTILFVLVFILLDPIWKLGAFRFGTAIHVFLFGLLPFLMEGKKNRLWISFLSIFVHFSFFAPILVLVGYILLGNKDQLYFLTFVLTFFISEIDIDFVRSMFDNLPDIFKHKATAYMTVDSYESQMAGMAQTNWYIKNYLAILKYVSVVFIIIFYLRKFIFFKGNHDLKSLWCFTLLFYTFANIANLLPQGVRFYAVANLLIFFMISIISSHSGLPVIFKSLRILAAPFLVILIVVDIRKGLDFTGLLTIFANPFIAPLISGDIPIIQFIK